MKSGRQSHPPPPSMRPAWRGTLKRVGDARLGHHAAMTPRCEEPSPATLLMKRIHVTIEGGKTMRKMYYTRLFEVRGVFRKKCFRYFANLTHDFHCLQSCQTGVGCGSWRSSSMLIPLPAEIARKSWFSAVSSCTRCSSCPSLCSMHRRIPDRSAEFEGTRQVPG